MSFCLVIICKDATPLFSINYSAVLCSLMHIIYYRLIKITDMAYSKQYICSTSYNNYATLFFIFALFICFSISAVFINLFLQFTILFLFLFNY